MAGCEPSKSSAGRLATIFPGDRSRDYGGWKGEELNLSSEIVPRRGGDKKYDLLVDLA